jgi:hypothetical protein
MLPLGLAAVAAFAWPAGAIDNASSSIARESGNNCPEPSMSAEQVKNATKDWPGESQRALSSMLDKYGSPNFVGCSTAMWKDKGPFRRIVVTRNPVDHQFPTTHRDVLAEEAAMRVPADKVDDLSRFNGSLIVDRVQGTVTARSDSEAHNILLLNLANDIITGKRDVASARRFQADTESKELSGKSSEYTDRLTFSEGYDTADADSVYSGSTAEPGGVRHVSYETEMSAHRASGDLRQKSGGRLLPLPGDSGTPEPYGY